jgi:hypothetical protein
MESILIVLGILTIGSLVLTWRAVASLSFISSGDYSSVSSNRMDNDDDIAGLAAVTAAGAATVCVF